MRIRLVIGFGGAVVAALAACTVTTNNPYPQTQDFCVAKAKAECSIANLCAINPADCQSWRQQLCTTDANNALASGTRMYVSGNAQACINAITSAYGTGDKPSSSIPAMSLIGPGSIQDKCERVFSGTADINATCTSDYDCIKNRICSPVAPGSSSKVCADAVNVAAMGFCANPGSVCPSDEYCAPAMTGAAQCQAAGQTGADCSKTPCSAMANLRCGPGNTCQARAVEGAACSTDADCVTSAPYCDPYGTPVCTTGLTFARGATDCSGYMPGSVMQDGGGSSSSSSSSGGSSSSSSSSGSSSSGGSSSSSSSGGSDAGGD